MKIQAIKTRLITYTHPIRLIAIHLFLLAICSSVGLYAQDNKPFNFGYPGNSEYGKITVGSAPNAVTQFFQFKVADDDHFPPGATNVPGMNVSSEFGAANGYGFWTISSNFGSNVKISGHDWDMSPDQQQVNTGLSSDWSPNTASGWVLLGNMISKPSESYDGTTNHPGVQPPGVISAGLFKSISGVDLTNAAWQVAANLNGSVRYVCVDPSDRKKFVVEGFNDNRGATSNDQQIDISLSDPHNPSDRQVVHQSIWVYPTTGGVPGTINTGLTTNGVVTSSLEPFTMDQFHIAMDTKYLYITYCTNTGTNYDVHAMAVNLSDGSIQQNITVKAGAGTGLSAQDCKRPTIGCDVRGPYNANGNPEFGVTFIQGNWSSTNSMNSNLVRTFVYNDGTSTPAKSVTFFSRLFFDPFTCNFDPAYTFPTHARVLVSSVANSTSPVYSVYVLCQPLAGADVPTDYHLLLYKNLTFNADTAFYVDGQANQTGVPLLPIVPSPLTTLGYSEPGILDKPIMASANPYDNQDLTSGYRQFHCLYQPNYLLSGTHIHPLLIIRGSDNGLASSGGCASSDTRVLLNQEIKPNETSPSAGNEPTVSASTTNYCMAINQMGIHVHWHAADRYTTGTPNTHYYARDCRSFDEPIEENTLMTNTCYIADGTGHGGTTGATTVGSNQIVTVWSDPNYGVSTSGGLFFSSSYTAGPIPGLNRQFNIGQLIYSTDQNTSFTIDGYSISYIGGSGEEPILITRTVSGNLYTYPNCAFIFNASGQNIKIGNGSSWDFFGTSLVNCFRNPSNGMVNLNGGTDYYGNILRATLNIHPGGQFNGVPITANLGDIEIQYGPNISPLSATSTVSVNHNASGLLVLDHDNNTFTDSKVNSYLPRTEFIKVVALTTPTNMEDVVMLINPTNAFDVTAFTLNSQRTNYTNLSSPSYGDNGIGVIYYSGGCEYGPNKVTLNNGSLSNMRFHATDPTRTGLEITNNSISGINQYMIHIQENCNLYKDITISGNTFSNILDNDYDPDYCIQVEGCNNSAHFGEVNIDNNMMDFSSAPSSVGDMDGAIRIISSTCNIEGNTIKGKVFTAGISSDVPFPGGIILTSPDNTATFSYLCSNTLTGLAKLPQASKIQSGIVSDNYKGYVKLASISGCDIGYLCGFNDHPNLFYSNISGCIGPGIETSSKTTVFDMSGAHGATSTGDDYAAFNTISGNGGSNTFSQVLLAGGSHIEYGARLAGWSWQNWGQNNTIGFSRTIPTLITTDGGICDLVDLTNNWWGTGNCNLTNVEPAFGSSGTPGMTASNGLWDLCQLTVYAIGITYSPSLGVASSNFNSIGTSSDSTSNGLSVDCSGRLANTKNKHINPKPLSIQVIDSCQRWHGWLSVKPTTQQEAKMQYDTLRHYIESCGKNYDSYDAFNGLDGAVYLMSDDPTRFESYRAWLISVLYLNTTQPYYFCACMGSIAGTYQYSKYHPLATLAILKYLDTNGCDDKGLRDQIISDSSIDFQQGYDPTHLPSLDSLGLGFLLHHSLVTPAVSGMGMEYLASFTTKPNPFTTETTLDFTLNRMGYITIAIYDVLGRWVWGDTHGSSLEPGEHTVHIDGTNLPVGTLYARISTGFGEVKTVKLVHEK